MEPIYITGHRNPDTDSIVASLSYAMLKNALGDRAYTAARIGELSDQTELLLKKFDFTPPMLLHTVRTQVSDLDYDTPPILSAAVSVYHAWQTIVSDNTSIPTLPVTDENGRLYGMLTPEEIAAYDMRFIKNNRLDGIPVFNLLACLDGRLISASIEQTELSGSLLVALPTHAGLPDIGEDSIVICGNQPEVIHLALERRAAALSRLAGMSRAHVSLVRLPPGKDSFAYHAHMLEEEWIYIVSGRAIAEIEGKTAEVGPGDPETPRGGPAQHPV